MNVPLWSVWDSTPCSKRGIDPELPGQQEICIDCPIREFCIYTAGGEQ
jgi:hypothetical protein